MIGVTTKPNIVPIGMALFVIATDLALSLNGIHLAYKLCHAGKVIPFSKTHANSCNYQSCKASKNAQGVIKVNIDQTIKPTPRTNFAPILSDKSPPMICVRI